MNSLGFEKNTTFCPRLAPLRIHELQSSNQGPMQHCHPLTEPYMWRHAGRWPVISSEQPNNVSRQRKRNKKIKRRQTNFNTLLI
jgi:hypothetical protein